MAWRLWRPTRSNNGSCTVQSVEQNITIGLPEQVLREFSLPYVLHSNSLSERPRILENPAPAEITIDDLILVDLPVDFL
ncbi:hypothetical protein NU688_28930 [Variovorax sp. ZS18.2.2]|uniref:hypothetical protein n=1 Tax=Variovorax sp. ZS18.2.2 TaxID=2971255 RepID=UPI002150BC2A|nr:hypothetical protein [Variovorax sp. ZS18.2.2]MCR6480213.1 hypothetical protein [Variovorax sp. ZS18.2.2]